MTCANCKTEHLNPKGEEMQVCWCRIDFCVRCIEAHAVACKWALSMDYKPLDKKKKAKKLPRIGHQSHAQF